MATCLEHIQSNLEFISTLQPNVAVNLTFSKDVPKAFKVLSSGIQTVNLQISLSSASSFNYRISLFKFDEIDNTYTLQGQSNISDGGLVVPLLFEVGTYFICFRANITASYTGNVRGNFTTFPQTQTFSVNIAYNSKLTASFASPPRLPCGEALKFEIVDGEFPQGLKMNLNGRIEGDLPLVDCLPDRDLFSPSQNWFYSDSNGVSQPFGRTWRFKLRVSLALLPTVFQEDWFCLTIFNDWSLDRDNFLKNAPFTRVVTEIVKESPKVVQNICQPCSNDQEVVNFEQGREVIANALQNTCQPCQVIEEEIFTPKTISLPETLQSSVIENSDLIVWYLKYRDSTELQQSLQDFLGTLEGNKVFQLLLSSQGIIQTSQVDPNIVTALENYGKYLESILGDQIDGRNLTDLDFKMLQMRDLENEKMPYHARFFTGEFLEASLDDDNTKHLRYLW